MEKKTYPDYDIRVLLKKTLIKDVMSTPVITINEHEEFSVVEEAFVNNEIRHLPVTGEGGKLVGIMTKRDLFRTIAPRRAIEGSVTYTEDKIIDKKNAFYFKETLDSFILNKIMVTPVYTLKQDNVIADAIRIMTEKRVGCIPVVDDNKKVRGIITRYDILKMANQIVNE